MNCAFTHIAQVSLTLLFLVTGVLEGKAVDTLVLGEGDHYYASSYMQVFEDTSNAYTFQEVRSANEVLFGTQENTPDHVERSDVTYWVRFFIKANEAGASKRWLLEYIDPHIDYITFYIPSEQGDYKEKRAGYNLAFEQRNYFYKNFLCDINPGKRAKAVYVKIRSDKPNHFHFELRSSHYFAFYALKEYYLLGVFYGILVIMIVYNMLIYFSVRENLYLYFSLYVFCCALVTFHEDGLGFQYLWSSYPVFNVFLSKFSPLILVLAFSFYARKFLELPVYLPVVNRYLNYLIIAFLIFYVFDVGFFQFRLGLVAYSIIPFTFIYIAAIMALYRGLRMAKFFVVGYSFLFLSLILLLGRMTGLLQMNNVYMVYSFNAGLIIEIVMFSFALGHRMRLTKEAKEQAQQEVIEQYKQNEEIQQEHIKQLKVNDELREKVNKELEAKVSERTQELEQKNEELEQANSKLDEQRKQIEEMNEQLARENKSLYYNVKELTRARVFKREVDFKEFGKIFPDELSCLRYLAELKWENGFQCKKCGNDKYCEGKTRFSRRCTRCRYDESPTAFTIFHRCKFPITKAFYMVFLIYSNNGDITSKELSQILDLRQSTCWNFSKKVMAAMKKHRKSGSRKEEAGHEGGWSEIIFDT